MPSLKEVKKMVKNLVPNVSTFATKKEINFLPEVLVNEEKILYRNSSFLNGDTWLITCTNKCVIFLDKGMIFDLKQIEIPLENKFYPVKDRPSHDEIAIWDVASKMEIKNILKDTVKPFVDAINGAIAALKQQNQPSSPVVPQNDEAVQLEKFVELKNKGIISEEEFQAKKKQILGI